MVTVDSIGASGGLALFWKREIDVTVKSISEHHIDCVVKEENGLQWRVTGIYVESRSEEKDNTWQLLRNLRNKYNMPWFYSGDFNEILFGCEKDGGPARPKACMQ